MMLRTSDLNLNQFGGSLKEAMKRTIIQHEIIFNNQVRELHRLYWTQRNLMGELYHKDSEAKEQSRVVGFAREGNVGCLEEGKGKFVDFGGNRERGFNLELPAKDYIRDSGYYSVSDKVTDWSTKEEINEKGSDDRSLIDRGKNLHCYEVIDLEERAEMGSESDVEAYRTSLYGFKIPLGRGEVIGCLKSDIASDAVSSKRARNESGFLPGLNHLHVGCGERWEEREVRHSGVAGESESTAAVVDRSTDSTHKQEPSLKPILIDLNIAQDEESFHPLDDPVIPFPSPSSSSSVVQNDHFCKDQVLNIHQNETSDPPLLVFKENGSRVSDNNNREQEHEGSDEDTVSSHIIAQEEKQQKRVNENFLPGKSTECSSLDKSIEENSGTTQLDNMVFDEGTVFDAAVILANLSLVKSINIETEVDESEQPQYSLDSFEKMNLELPEIESKEQLTPTSQTEKDEVDEVTGVSRLRRGRGRVRDFQKDILPGMVTLSRHEICEDMHNIGYVLRKYGSRNGGGANWFVPVRSQRSRRNPTCRRS